MVNVPQFTMGAEAYSKGEFTSALEHFLASNRLASNRNVMFIIARAYEQLGRFPAAAWRTTVVDVAVDVVASDALPPHPARMAVVRRRMGSPWRGRVR